MEVQSFYPWFSRSYRTLAPLFEKPKVRAYTMLTLSFFTMAIFGMFAIRPTLATITQLRKQIGDERLVLEKMTQKITALGVAQGEYEKLKPDFDAIFQALPAKAQVSSLLGKLNRVLSENNIDLTLLQFSAVSLSVPTPIPSQATMLEFTITARGSYEDILVFLDMLGKTDRVITLDIIDISKAENLDKNLSEGQLRLAIKGKSYVLW